MKIADNFIYFKIKANDFNCKAFMYNNQTRSCILSDERSRPLGRASLTDAKGWTYHEKKCFASPRTCRNVPSFTRVPQMLLVGFASFVMENVPSVTMCLDQCTKQECILNAESRHSKPDLFIPEEDDFVVDYFDINCHLEAEQCIDGRTPQLVRTINSALPEGEGSIHVLETIKGGVQQCAKKCFEHAPDKCRSFNFDKQAGNCNLLYLDGQGSLRPEQKTQFDLYDVHCLSGNSQLLGENTRHSPSACVDPEGAIFSRFLYTRWVANSPNREISSLPLSKCLNLCSAGGEQCEGVNYNRRNGSCQLFTSLSNLNSPSSQQDKDEHVDFYRNICRVKESKSDSGAANVPKTQQATAAPPPSVQLTTKPPNIRNLNNNSRTQTNKEQNIKIPTQSKKTSNGKVGKEEPPLGAKTHGVTNTVEESRKENSINGGDSLSQTPVDGKLSVKPSPQVSIPSPVLIPAQEVHTICNYEGISVQIKHSSQFSGVVFVRNKYDTCRVEVEGKDSVVLVLGLPANFGMKPIALINPQKHGKGNKTHGDNLLSIEGSKKQNEGSSNENIHEINSLNQKQTNVDLKRSRRQLQRDCGLQDMDNGTYKTVIVVQTNNLGIPGLVTSMDQLYEAK
uniref:PAN domain protein n=1 Tax=Meloidogyne hapla TaxID=6305 RepID=A0A1I8BYM1_MELHA